MRAIETVNFPSHGCKVFNSHVSSLNYIDRLGTEIDLQLS